MKKEVETNSRTNVKYSKIENVVVSSLLYEYRHDPVCQNTQKCRSCLRFSLYKVCRYVCQWHHWTCLCAWRQRRRWRKKERDESGTDSINTRPSIYSPLFSCRREAKEVARTYEHSINLPTTLLVLNRVPAPSVCLSATPPTCCLLPPCSTTQTCTSTRNTAAFQESGTLFEIKIKENVNISGSRNKPKHGNVKMKNDCFWKICSLCNWC